MRDKTVVFVYEYGDNAQIMFESDNESNDPIEFVTYEKMFLEMGFKKADLETIANDIHEDSSTMIGDAKQITDYCKKYRKFNAEHHIDTHRICTINSAKKIKYRYNDKKKLEVYSHAFEWQNGSEIDLDRITNVKREIGKQNIGEVYPFTGGGFRETNTDKSKVNFNMNFPIPQRYLQCNNGKTLHNCVWLNTACIIPMIDEDDGNHMIDLFERKSCSAKEYEWLNVKPPKDQKLRQLAVESGEETLTDKMVRDVGYHVCRVSKVEELGSSYLNQFLHPDSKGKYIARLLFSDNNDQHYVSIDCDNRLIWDTLEEYAMDLTLENLNYCSGKDGIHILKIMAAYKFQDNRKKRKSVKMSSNVIVKKGKKSI